MTGRQRIADVLRRKPVDRVPLTEVSFWPETVARWRADGLPRDMAPADFFDLELRTIGFDHTLMRPSEVLEDGEETQVRRDPDGVVRRVWKHKSGVPEPLDYPLKRREDWPALRADMASRPERLPADAPRQAREFHRQGRFVCLAGSEPCFYCFRLMGCERFCMGFHDWPDLLCEIMAAMNEMWFGMYDIAVGAGVEFDGIWISGDLGYTNGSWMSPEHYRKYVFPYHRELGQFFGDKDIPIIWHCCGDERTFLPHLNEAGITCIQPMEARAGNDIRVLKPEYGDEVVFMGNIAVEKLTAGGDELEEEIGSKLTVAKQGGGYIFHSDHSIPPHVSLENYAFALELARKYGAYC